MNDEVSWVFEVAVKPGKIDALRTLMEEMVESTRAEPGALVYEWFVSDDEGVVLLYERYADSAAALTHSEVFGAKFAERFLDLVEPTRFTVLGTPSDEVKAALSRPGRAFLQPFGGFARGIGA
jgi:quinol monooxygenase YgiN